MTTLMLMLSAPQEQANPAQTLWQFLESGGPVMVPIAICSVLVLAFTLERWLALTRGRVCPSSLDPVLEKIGASQFDDARQELEQIKAPAARVLCAGLRREGYEVRDVEGAIEDQAQKEVERMQRNIRPLTLIAAVAPLLGLLGTVLGIADSFRRVSQAGMGKPEMLAGGINEALTTTIAGLCVAIPAMLLAAHLNGKVRRLVQRVDDKIAPTIERIAMRPQEHRDAA